MNNDGAATQEICRQPPPPEGLSSGCPMATMLEMLTRPWTLHILWVLSTQGAMRFGAMRRAVEGISPRLLTVRLRTLETEGLLRRTVLGGKQPAVVYSPTERLKDMHELMAELHRVGAKWRAEDAPAATAEVDEVEAERALSG